MKKHLNKLTSINEIRLLVLIYVATVIVLILYNLFSFGVDRILRATGILYYQVIEWDELTSVDIIAYENNTIISTSLDPQILLPEHKMLIESIRFNIEFTNNAGEIDAYYSTTQMPDFSVNNRVYGALDENGADFEFGLVNTTAVRIDPTNLGGEIGVFKNIELNPKPEFTDFFTLNAELIYFIIFIPAMFWAVAISLKRVLLPCQLN